MATLPNWPQLAQGQNSKNVKALQHLLVYRGYSISTDGIFGSGTRTAAEGSLLMASLVQILFLH